MSDNPRPGDEPTVPSPQPEPSISAAASGAAPAADVHTADDRGSTAATPSRNVPLLIGAAVVLVAVFAAVWLFGIARPPELPTVAESPARPDAAIAWVAWENNRSCVYVVEPAGEPRSLRCDNDGGELVAWTDEGIMLRRWTAARETDLVLDPRTGDVVARYDGSELGLTYEEGVYSERDGSLLTVEHEPSRTRLWVVEAPDAYDVHSGATSPDGNWVAMTDSARRLLVVPTDGSQQPAVWAETVEMWTTILWEGQDRRTELDEEAAG
ncbi:MAG: hypothetical protein WD576_01880 [Nitriliruptoraceae bacterium]